MSVTTARAPQRPCLKRRKINKERKKSYFLVSRKEGQSYIPKHTRQSSTEQREEPSGFCRKKD